MDQSIICFLSFVLESSRAGASKLEAQNERLPVITIFPEESESSGTDVFEGNPTEVAPTLE